jgi:streptogramin lyase
VTTLNDRLDARRTRRADFRRPRRNHRFWADAPESLRLEQRVLLALSVTSFPIPLVGIVQPQGITTGPDGNLWFAETGADKIGRMTPAGVVTQFSLPPIPIPDGSQPSPGSAPGPVGITVGPDGALWFVGVPGEIGRITTAGVVTEFPVPAVPPPPGSPAGTQATTATLTGITAGPDGALWFTGIPGEVGRITTAGVVTEFPVPEVPPPAGSPAGTPSTPATPTGITAGPDGALWLAGIPGEVARITTAGVVTEFAVPVIPPPAGSGAGTAPTLVTPNGITLGPDGALWFTAYPAPGDSFVGRITATGAVTEFAATGFDPGSTIVTGADGNLWLLGTESASGDSAIGRLTPAGVFTTFTVPGNFSKLAGLTTGPNGNVWFTEEEDGITVGEQPAVGEISPAGVTTLDPIPQGTTLDPSRGVNVDPTAITTGPDGAIWFTDLTGIGRITTSGTIEQFPLTTPGATAQNITSGPDDTLWFTQFVPDANGNEAGSIGRITTSGAITVYPLRPDASIAGIVEAHDGDLWFTENFNNPHKGRATDAIGRITPQGVTTTFPAPAGGAITIGPDGNIWFSGNIQAKKGANYTVIGEVTATGHIKVFDLPTTSPTGLSSYPVADPYSLISGPDGKLWFDDKAGQTEGIARISTGGKLASTIPAGFDQDLARGPNGLVWFLSYRGRGTDPLLSVATRSGIVVTNDLSPQDLPYTPAGITNGPGGISNMAVGPDGNLWLANGTSGILRISGLETPTGALDYRHRPRRAPDYDRVPSGGSYWDPWTNITSNAQPTFAGIAQPGAELTLWAQMQGQSQPIKIGQVKANTSDGSWTLKSKVRLANGNYAVTATQSGDAPATGALYSLEPDSSGNLSNALVIDAKKPARSIS